MQLETREGPSSETFTDAALPRPVPEPEQVEDVLDDPGTSSRIVDAPAMANSQPITEAAPLDVSEAVEAALAAQAPDRGPVLTTVGESTEQVAIAGEQRLDDGALLTLLVEKDFACLAPRPGEDESDMFPHPEADAGRC